VRGAAEADTVPDVGEPNGEDVVVNDAMHVAVYVPGVALVVH
jgi:hypothetical protein